MEQSGVEANVIVADFEFTSPSFYLPVPAYAIDHGPMRVMPSP